MINIPISHLMEREGIAPKSSSRQEEPGLEPSGLTPRPPSPAAPPLPPEWRQTVLEGKGPCARSSHGNVSQTRVRGPPRVRVPCPTCTELFCTCADIRRKRSNRTAMEEGLGGFLFQIFSLMELTWGEPTELINDDRHGEGLIFIFKKISLSSSQTSCECAFGPGRVL